MEARKGRAPRPGLDTQHDSAARQGRETPNWAIVFKVVEVPILCHGGKMPNRFPDHDDLLLSSRTDRHGERP